MRLFIDDCVDENLVLCTKVGWLVHTLNTRLFWCHWQLLVASVYIDTAPLVSIFGIIDRVVVLHDASLRLRHVKAIIEHIFHILGLVQRVLTLTNHIIKSLLRLLRRFQDSLTLLLLVGGRDANRRAIHHLALVFAFREVDRGRLVRAFPLQVVMQSIANSTERRVLRSDTAIFIRSMIVRWRVAALSSIDILWVVLDRRGTVLCTQTIHIGLLVCRWENPLTILFASWGRRRSWSRAKTLLTLLTLLLSLRVNLGQLLAHLDFLKMHKLPLMAVLDSSCSFFSVYKGIKVTLIGLIGDA